jgi:hypothetical protein
MDKSGLVSATAYAWYTTIAIEQEIESELEAEVIRHLEHQMLESTDGFLNIFVARLAIAQRRIGTRHRVRFLQQDALTSNLPAGHYDGVLTLFLCGCGEWTSESPKVRTGAVGVTTEGVDELGKPVNRPAERTGIVGQKTDEIGKFDPNAKQEVSQQKIQATDIVTAPVVAYGPMVERISIIEIEHAVRLFHAMENRYPKDYDEFMEKIVKANNIRLPVLPYGGKYQYNEQTHALEIVRPQPNQQ